MASKSTRKNVTTASDKNNDIQTDAVIDNEECSEHSSSKPSISNGKGAMPQSIESPKPIRSSVPNSLPSNSLVYAQSARPMTPSDDWEYMKFLSHMPADLQEDNMDILIINADNDRKEAVDFKQHLVKDIIFYIHEQPRRPRVKLLEEIRHGSMDHLDLAFSKALYVFLYVTVEFCKEPWTLLQGQACLTEAIHDKDKKWCVVPIHTRSKKSKSYKLPMMLNSLRPINYWSGDEDQFYVEGVRKLLESKIGLLLERDRLLHEARQKHFEIHRSEIMRNFGHHKKSASFPLLATCETSGAASHVSPLTCSSHIQEESEPPLNPSSKTFHAEMTLSDVQSSSVSFSSCPDLPTKALPDESEDALQRRLEEINISEQQSVPSVNSLAINFRNTSALQTDGQPAASDVDLANRSVRHEQQSTGASPVASAQPIQHNVQVQRPQQASLPMPAPISSSSRVPDSPYSSIVVDGPANVDQPCGPSHPYTCQSGNILTTQGGFVSSPISGVASSALPGARSDTQAGATTSTQADPTHSQHHAAGTQIPPNSIILHNGVHYRMTLSGHMEPLYPLSTQQHQGYPSGMQCASQMSNPYSMPYYPPPRVPYYIPETYQHQHANPYYPQPYYFSNQWMQPPPQSMQSGSLGPQTSTEVNTSGSHVSHIPHSFSTGAVNYSNPYSHVSHWPPNQYPIPPGYPVFPPLATQAAAFPAAASSAGLQGESHQAGSFQQPQQSAQVPASGVEDTTVKHQLDLPGGMNIGENKPTGLASTTTASGGGGIVQHVHHHHHRKEIRVEKATNVLIGDKSQFLNRTPSSNVVDDEDEKDSDDDSANDENDTDHHTSPASAVTSTRCGEHDLTQGTQGRSIPSADGGGPSHASQPTTSTSGRVAMEDEDTSVAGQIQHISVGFPECEEPATASTRQPQEVSDDLMDITEQDEQNQTGLKKCF